MGGDADIATVAALLAEPARARVLLALADGRALPAGMLAAEAGVAASTASEHLAKLVAARLLAVEPHGRFRYYRLSGRPVAQVLEALAQIAPPEPIRSLRQGTRAQLLRAARTCYDHLAGRLGVAIMTGLLDAGHVTGGDGTFDAAEATHDRLSAAGQGDVDYRLTDSGRASLAALGVALPARPGPLRYCVDWTEQRHHLAGPAGRAIFQRLIELDWVRRNSTPRAVTVTPTGRHGLAEHFNVDWPPAV